MLAAHEKRVDGEFRTDVYGEALKRKRLKEHKELTMIQNNSPHSSFT